MLFESIYTFAAPFKAVKSCNYQWDIDFGIKQNFNVYETKNQLETDANFFSKLTYSWTIEQKTSY